MKPIKHLSIVLVLLMACNTFSQNRNWTEETLKDGKTTVKYELVKEDQGTHFYYIAQTTVNTTLDKLDTYFSNTDNHKLFLERTPITKQIEKISNNQWLAYYYFNAPWPLSDSDLVIKITRFKENNKLKFIATATSSDYKTKEVERMKTYKVIYQFEKIDDTTTKITYNADYIPIGSIPNFLIKTWFPEGPANIVINLGATKQK
ncbi:hypothetical protein [uncultured Olleya sp.]|uniref:hypothetical protein n=1 Tax=uncultured Olleya sp. TaxID=757243 RepID=UPI002595DB3E|nr:hypothetical protein [uncultured Olleya sp.]